MAKKKKKKSLPTVSMPGLSMLNSTDRRQPLGLSWEARYVEVTAVHTIDGRVARVSGVSAINQGNGISKALHQCD